jgi:hypothetical protein
MVGAIHGRLLTRMGDSRCARPVVVNYMRGTSSDSGCRANRSTTMYILVEHAGGRFDLQPLGQTPGQQMVPDGRRAAQRKLAHERAAAKVTRSGVERTASARCWVFAWTAVGLPLAWACEPCKSVAKFFA